jgi:nucleotide-binding universal stress UspA family protein
MNATGGPPVVVAYDGSAEAQASLRQAVALFADRLLLVVSIWEPSLATLEFAAPTGDPGLVSLPPDPATVAAIDEAQRNHAGDVAEAGARLARELGATAEAVPVADEANVAETIARIAEQRDACVVVVGSRGLGGFKRHLLGSTTQRLLRDGHPPVLVVRTR